MAETINKLQFMDLENFRLAKELLDAETLKQIDLKTGTSIKTVSQSADKYTIYFYTKTAPVTETDAAFSITLPSPVDISRKADKVSNATSGNFAGLDNSGNLTDSGKKAADFELVGASEKVKSQLLTLIGSIPPAAVAKNIVAYIQEEVTAGKYDDTVLKVLANSNKDAISVLNGIGSGSVKKAIADALIEFTTGADESLNSFKELSDWILNHSSDAAGMNSRITANTTEIGKVKSLIGTIPSTATAKNVIDYVAEYVAKTLADSDMSQYAKAKDLAAAVTRIGTLETDLGTTKTNVSSNTTKINNLTSIVGNIPSGSTATTIVAFAQEIVAVLQTQLTQLTTRVTTAEGKITTLITDMGTAKTDIGTNKTAITKLQGLMGDGFEPIPEASIRALFS